MPERFQGYGNGFHCGELHTQIGELLKMLGKGIGYPLTECAKCGAVMIRQTEDNSEGNEAMEVCSRCSYELAYGFGAELGAKRALDHIQGLRGGDLESEYIESALAAATASRATPEGNKE